MEKFLLRSLLLLNTLYLISCSGTVNDNLSGIASNTVISGSFSQRDEDKISGSGTIRFLESLTISSSRALALKASLDDSISASSLVVVLFSSNSVIPTNSGIAITFSRSGASVTGSISYNGQAVSMNSGKLGFYFPASLDLVVEVHNVASQARVLIWRRNMVEYSSASADIDTLRDGDIVGTVPGQNGPGPYAGLILQSATVTAAQLESQRVLD